MKTRILIVCVGIVLLASLYVSQAQAPTLIGYAAAKCRLSDVSVYSTGNLFSNRAVNGFTNVAVYGQWTFGGGSKQIIWGSPTAVKSSGTFASSQGSYAATCEVFMNQETQKVGYVIKRADTGAVLRTSAGMKSITWGVITVKPPLVPASPKANKKKS